MFARPLRLGFPQSPAFARQTVRVDKIDRNIALQVRELRVAVPHRCSVNVCALLPHASVSLQIRNKLAVSATD